MKKRERLEVIYDILTAASKELGPTRLLYASNLSPKMFRDYVAEMLEKKFIIETNDNGKKTYVLTDKGYKFLEKYREIVSVIEEFGL